MITTLIIVSRDKKTLRSGDLERDHNDFIANMDSKY